MSEYYDPASNKVDVRIMPMPQYAKEYFNYLLIERNLAPRSVFNYSVSIQTFLRWVKFLEMGRPDVKFQEIDVEDVELEKISHFTRNDIYDFLSFCASTLSNAAASRAAKLSALTSFYGYLCEKSVYASSVENPTLGVAKPKLEKTLPKYLTLEECKKLLSVVTGKTEARDYCIIFWFMSCGMRLSELSGINLTDIKDDKLLLHGKGRKERVLHMSKPCMDIYAAYLVERSLYGEDLDDKALFISPRTGKRLTGRRIEQILESYLAMAGLQGNGYSPHKLRHTAATLLYQQGNVGLLEISEILGHASVGTTQIYTHITGENTRSALEEISSVLVD